MAGTTEANRLTQIEKAKEMARKDIKPQEIADTLGVSRMTVYRWLKEN